MKLHVLEFATDSQIFDKLNENSSFMVDYSYVKLLNDEVFVVVPSDSDEEIRTCLIQEDEVIFYNCSTRLKIKIEEIIKLDDLHKAMILRFFDNVYSLLDKNVALALLRKLQIT